MSDSSSFVQVKTFISPTEIWSLFGFRVDNPINKNNYDKIIGDYLIEEKLECCFQKANGNLCKHKHKWGFVAELKDRSITIVGNCCAIDKFGADAQIKIDRSKYVNEKQRLEKIKSIKKLVAAKDINLERIAKLQIELKELQDNLLEFEKKLGDQTIRKLEDMARTKNARVTINAVTYKEYQDDKDEKKSEIKGEKKIEKRVSPTNLGSIKGVSIFNKTNFHNIFSQMHDVIDAYARAEKITDDIKSKNLNSLISDLSGFDVIVKSGEDLLTEGANFFKNDFSLLCFIVDDKPERYKCARIAMEQDGSGAGKDEAKHWLSEKERDIKQTLKADKLQIV